MFPYMCRVKCTSYILYQWNDHFLYAGNDLSCKRDRTNLLIWCAYFRGLFESQYYINKVGDVDWVCLASGRNMCKAPLSMVTSLQVV